MPSTLVILGTGGTIAGTAADASDHVGYVAAQRPAADLAAELVAAMPALAGQALEVEQVAQLDSKDMDFQTWQLLAQRVAHHLARPQVQGIVVTHGTDTAEETAWFLQRVLAPAKPVVLAVAMRPATSHQSDGPQNLMDAAVVAREPGACGVTLVAAGTVHGAHDVRKVHTYRLDAFGSGDAGPIARVEQGRLRRHRTWPMCPALGLERLGRAPAFWPRVEVIVSHAGANARIVEALVDAGVQGIVVAGTGNGTLHRELDEALRRAVTAGVAVWRSTRCPQGVLVGSEHETMPAAASLSPWQARIELMLSLMAG